MKKYHYAVAAAALLASTSLATAENITGIIGANLGGETGHFEADNGYDWYVEDGVYVPSESYGKLGITVAPEFTIQIDGAFSNHRGYGVWEEFWDDEYYDGDFYSSNDVLMLVSHFTYRKSDFFVGGLAGVLLHGDLPELDMTADGILGVEAGYDAENFSLFVQAGLAAHEDWDDWNAVFAGFGVNYYVNPDFSIGTSASVSHDSDEDTAVFINFDARYKLEDSPLVLSAGYRGEFTSDLNSQSSAHRVTVGLSVPFGAPSTLRDIDRATGLKLVEY